MWLSGPFRNHPFGLDSRGIFRTPVCVDIGISYTDTTRFANISGLVFLRQNEVPILKLVPVDFRIGAANHYPPISNGFFRLHSLIVDDRVATCLRGFSLTCLTFTFTSLWRQTIPLNTFNQA